MPRFDLGMRRQSTTKDESGERQYGEPFTERDPKREVRNVTGPGEQEEVHSHDRDSVDGRHGNHSEPDERTHHDRAIDNQLPRNEAGGARKSRAGQTR